MKPSSAFGIPQINEEILNAEEGFMTALGKINMVPGGGIPQLITNKTDGIVTSDLTKEVSAILVPFLPETVYPQPSLDDMSQERINAIRQDLIKYRDESVTKFIIGEWGFDQWDTYCETLEKIGLSEMQQISQDAFDALYKEDREEEGRLGVPSLSEAAPRKLAHRNCAVLS